MKRFEKITKLIPLLESEETHGEWIIDREHKGTPDDPILMALLHLDTRSTPSMPPSLDVVVADVILEWLDGVFH